MAAKKKSTKAKAPKTKKSTAKKATGKAKTAKKKGAKKAARRSAKVDYKSLAMAAAAGAVVAGTIAYVAKSDPKVQGVGSIKGDIRREEKLKHIDAILHEIETTGKVPTAARLQSIASIFSLIPGGKPSPIDATWRWTAWLKGAKAKLEGRG